MSAIDEEFVQSRVHLDLPGDRFLTARLGLQRAVEEEATEFLGRARYQRTAEARGSRNGVRPRREQTAEGELEVQIPQLRDTAEQFVGRVIPDMRMVIRTRPLGTDHRRLRPWLV